MTIQRRADWQDTRSDAPASVGSSAGSVGAAAGRTCCVRDAVNPDRQLTESASPTLLREITREKAKANPLRTTAPAIAIRRNVASAAAARRYVSALHLVAQ